MSVKPFYPAPDHASRLDPARGVVFGFIAGVCAWSGFALIVWAVLR